MGNKIVVRSEKRREDRKYDLTEPLVELRLPNLPVYQLKLYDVSQHGSGVVLKPDSKLLPQISIGQELRVRVLTPGVSVLEDGDYDARVEHMTEVKTGRFNGHYIVGLSLEKKKGFWL